MLVCYILFLTMFNPQFTETMNSEKWFFNALLLFFSVKFCSSIDTLIPNQSIKDGDVLVSEGKTFALGFFSPGNSSFRYVGIWYNKISQQTVVWVGNRDNPIKDNSGVLLISQHGYLVIYDGTQNSTVWQGDVSAVQMPSNISYSARLLDSGNFVVFGGSNGVVWQSFDYPTHTMLPNMKLGLDRKTGLERFLTSWKSRDDPGTGKFLYRMDPSGSPQLVLRKGSARIWRTGPWVDNQWSGIPEMTSNFIFNASYVDNEEELSVMYGLLNASITSIMFLDESGSMQRITWQDYNRRWVGFWSAPKDRCDYYGRCGVFGNCDPNIGDLFECTCLPGYEPRSVRDWYLRDSSGGCVRKHVPLGMCSKGEGFVKVARAKVPDTSRTARSEKNLSMEACKEECLRNCTCTAYTSGGGGECITWYGNLTDTRVLLSAGLDLYVRVDATELAQQSKKTRRFQEKKIAIVVASVVLASLLLISLACWFVIKRRRGLYLEDTDEENLELPVFDMVTIESATNRFCVKNKIGEGGFGLVYKGHLPTGKEIAVKRLSVNSEQGLKEFKNEVVLIAKLQHRNLVRLWGCCIHEEERMLIYEYMPNGSLDSFIFGSENRSKLLTWRRRLNIIVGIARGVVYLHQDSRLRVIHRDLKASNVLLDNEMNPKISDFGLARAFGGDESSAITRRIVGTYGYMPPEYVIDGIFSTKSDAYSFGVIILEILSGQRNRLFHHPDHDFNLLGHAWNLWDEGKAGELLDPVVEGSLPMPEVLRCIQVGLLCVQKSPEHRPNMLSALLMLITESAVLAQPRQPGFYTERCSNKTDNFPSGRNSSINDMTSTQVDAR